MGKKNIFLYILVVCLIASLIYNYILYKQNESFMIDLGTQYKYAAQNALFQLKEGATDFWLAELNEVYGGVLLERHLGTLQQLSSEFNKMSNAANPIGLMLYSLADNYRTLAKQVYAGDNTDELTQIIEARIHFTRAVLNKMVNDFGDNNKLWYTELSKYDSNTAKYVHEQFKQLNWKVR